MRNPRLYYPDLIKSENMITLDKGASHYLYQVLRCKSGQTIEMFNGNGLVCDAVIISSDKHSISVQIQQFQQYDTESPLAITLALGISKGERMDTAIQKAVELGVHTIQPLQTEFSVVRLKPERAKKRLQHWHRIITSACEQCGRNTLPTLLPILTFYDWLNQERDTDCWLFHPDSTTRLSAVKKPTQGVTILIGPEGGLSENEIINASSREFSALNFGPRILRTETAAIASLAAIQTLWGDMG